MQGRREGASGGINSVSLIVLAWTVCCILHSAYPCSSRKHHKLQIRTDQAVGINDILEHVLIDSNLLDIIIDCSKDFI